MGKEGSRKSRAVAPSLGRRQSDLLHKKKEVRFRFLFAWRGYSAVVLVFARRDAPKRAKESAGMQRDRLESRLRDLRMAEIGSAAWMEAVWAVEAMIGSEHVEGEKEDGTIDEARVELARGIVQASYECLGAHAQYQSIEACERV